MERIDRLLTKLGYGSRKEVQQIIKRGRVKVEGLCVRNPSQKAKHATVTIDGEPLDPEKLIIVMHKPKNIICSHNDAGLLIYSLLPERYQRRNPKISTVGRLDKDTTGIILLTDDGSLNHTLTSPKKEISKIYEVTLASPLNGSEVATFASGELMLNGEEKPCISAKLTIIDPYHAQVELKEGKYHQVKRMFAATGNHVVELHRSKFSNLTLDGLAEGEFKLIENNSTFN
ncbi:rRNA pseudouridine synthase [bacterium]|nr:rRNA pseudouridine synthase [bacterium]MBU1957468.1 rRNA pseudouridine synthase [bacterium]